MKALRSCLLLVLLSVAAPAPGALLFDLGDLNWRWRPGTNEASAPITAWRAPGFADSQFVTAPAPFWYGDVRAGGTQIGGMQNVYSCVFLRKTFNVPSAAAVGGLRLRYFIDDGLVVWINGTEVFRENVADAAPTIATLATNQAVDPAVLVTSPIIPAAGLLVDGANTIAVQVFQSSLNSSDLGFDLALESIVNETTPPTIQSAAPASGSTVNGLSAITVTFSEAVTGVDAGDLLINAVPATGVAPLSSSAYSFSFAQPAYGNVQITWNGGHGIADEAFTPNSFNAAGPGATWQYTLVDQTAPTVATLSPAANETVRSLTNITVVFSESVAGIDAGDLKINNVAATGLVGGANLYTFSFPQPATGLVQVAWAAGHGITDLASIPNPFAGGNWLLTLDPNAADGTGPIISEFMAFNTNGPNALLDEDGDSSDWVEIENVGASSTSLLDWSLTDDDGNLTKWRFPATNLPPGGLLVIFASEKDRRVPGARLHTNFKLNGAGGYLALVRPDGTIASEFAPYPPQVSGVSYGLGVLSTNSTLVFSNSLVRVQIPANGSDATNWLYAGFNDTSWTAGTNGVGYGSTNVTQADYSAAVLPTGPLTYWRLNETSGTVAANLGSMDAAGNATYQNSPTLGADGPRPPLQNGFESDNRAVGLSGTAGTDYVGGPVGLLNNRAAFTMAGWIRPTAAQAARTGLFGQNDCVEFGFISAGNLHAWTPSGNIASFAYPFPNNEWHHIALVGANNQLLLFLDGTQRANSAGAAPSSGSGFNIGGGGVFDATGNDFVGQIDEVAVWDRALSQPELAALHSAGTNPVSVATVRFVTTHVGSAMSNVNATAYVRVPFTIPDPSNVQLLTLRVRHDDGFVAYLNGIEVARANAPGSLAYNSAATDTHSAITVDQFQFGAAMLADGANMLSIHGLNTAPADEDFLISAELTATHVAAASSGGVYMTGPSPGTANGGGVSVLGPAILETTHTPNVPTDSQDIVVTARVSPTFASIGSVVVRYRIMFNAEIELPMFDDGMHGDGLAGDGLYGQTLPVAAGSTNGQMIRWFVRAADTLGRTSRWPLFGSTADTEYLGTVVDPSYVTSQLPIFHLFAPATILQPGPPTTQIGADSETGGRLALFYDGEFYDNIYMELRGNTSATQQKKAHRVEFNRDHEFRHPGPGGRIRKTSFLSEPTDASYLHQHLSFWFLDKIGVPSPFDYPVRLQLNGAFYQLAFHNDVIGQEQMERLGYDPEGALYKAVGNVKPDFASTGVFQKLEPDSDPSRTDYLQLANGINEASSAAVRRATVFDLLDLPQIINHLAGTRWCSENDDVWANMSMYRDTFGDQLWRCIPFDMNASWGQRYGGNNPLEAASDDRKSHPLYGGLAIDPMEGPAGANRWNRLYDVIIALPETREMLLRRMRSIMDRWIQPPGTPAQSLIIESYIKQMTNLMAAEALMDRTKWGPTTWLPTTDFLTSASNLMSQFVGPRRTHWYVTHSITNAARVTGTNSLQKAGIPLGQPAQSLVSIGAIEFNPASTNQAQEFICITNANPYALDLTGWKLSKGVEFTFKPGTVMPSNSVLYVSPNVLAFKQRTIGPRGGQGLFVVGPYQGQLSARGESLVLRDDTGYLVLSNSYSGAPSLAQQYLRVTEIMYNPSALDGNTNDAQQFEYIELRNISGGVTLDLNGVRFVNGIEFSFTGSAITSLLPGARVLVVRNATAFAARYGGGLPVAGQYLGTLDSGGERLQLVDHTNEEIHDFSYNNSWYPVTDGLGFSLVVSNDTVDPDLWGNKSNWRPSGALTGSPGAVDPAPPSIAPVVINELLTASVLPDVDAVELHNPTASPVNLGGWFLSDDQMTPKKYRITNGCIIPAGGYLTFPETLFNDPAHAQIPFAFSSSGDEAWLTSGDANTNLTGYMTGENYGPARASVSFGRYTNSQGAVHFVGQAANSFGGANGSPRVGPIIISEVMYHPPDTQTLYGSEDNSIDEYIELRNISGVSQPLYDPANPGNTWRLRDAVDFTFPPGLTIPPEGHVILVSFDPSDTAAASNFRARNGASILAPLVGPFSGKLDNSTDSVELVAPNPPATNGLVAFYLADKVAYQQQAPWPTNADGYGSSLVRVVVGDYGNDPTNWMADARSPGYNASLTNGPVITSQPQNVTLPATRTAMFSISVSGDGPFAYQWRFNGTGLPGANSSTLTLSNIQPAQAGSYSCLVEGTGGVTTSSNATLTVLPAPTITQQPTNLTIRIRPDNAAAANTTAVFRVSASTANPPLSFQWQFHGTNLPTGHSNYLGVTSSNLIVTNITPAQAGPYNCALTDNLGTIYSQPATLTTWIGPVIIQQPQSQTIYQGDPVTLTVVLSNVCTGPFNYVWRSNSLMIASNHMIAGFTNSITLTNVPAISSTLFRYRCDIQSPAQPPQGTPTANALITTITNVDRDLDGLNDPWEQRYGLSTNNPADAHFDGDGDGMINLHEFQADTVPTNALSVLKVTDFILGASETFNFLAVSNRTYSVQTSGVLPATWATMTNISAAAANRTIRLTNPPAASPPHYIRLVTPQQP